MLSWEQGLSVPLPFGIFLQIKYAEMANGAIFIPVSELNLCQEYDPVVVCESKFLASLSFVKSNFFNIVFLCWPIDWPFALPASQQASVLATAGQRG